MTLHETRDSDKKAAALGLEGALTAAIAHAQIAGSDGDIIDRLLALKRDVLAAEGRGSNGRQAAT